MPIYEYKCKSCGTVFEKLVRRAEDAGGACPECGESQADQQPSRFAAHSNGAPSSRGSMGSEMPTCPSGMCSNPDFCGRN